MGNVQLDADEIFTLANTDPRVRAAVKKRGAQIASRTRKELSRAGIDAPVSIRERTLATGRATVDVVAAAPDGTERRVNKILRRAGREGRGRG
ncbi:hypothetical protein [Corynebacterium sp.]|uniref:hypothetical protein n=1 Tax=Corynebacterium sp. TaxID=1720 RepID=UPI0025C67C39|nr:hypothetical protein [Corynebacterium sp.]